VLLMILSYMEPGDLCRVSPCCSLLNSLCSDFGLWKNLETRHFQPKHHMRQNSIGTLLRKAVSSRFITDEAEHPKIAFKRKLLRKQELFERDLSTTIQINNSARCAFIQDCLFALVFPFLVLLGTVLFVVDLNEDQGTRPVSFLVFIPLLIILLGFNFCVGFGCYLWCVPQPRYFRPLYYDESSRSLSGAFCSQQTKLSGVVSFLSFCMFQVFLIMFALRVSSLIQTTYITCLVPLFISCGLHLVSLLVHQPNMRLFISALVLFIPHLVSATLVALKAQGALQTRLPLTLIPVFVFQSGLLVLMCLSCGIFGGLSFCCCCGGYLVFLIMLAVQGWKFGVGSRFSIAELFIPVFISLSCFTCGIGLVFLGYLCRGEGVQDGRYRLHHLPRIEDENSLVLIDD